MWVPIRVLKKPNKNKGLGDVKTTLALILVLLSTACGDDQCAAYAGGMCVQGSAAGKFAGPIELITDQFSRHFRVDFAELLYRKGVVISFVKTIEDAGGDYSRDEKLIRVAQGTDARRLITITHELLHVWEDVLLVPFEESKKHLNQEYFGIGGLQTTLYLQAMSPVLREDDE